MSDIFPMRPPTKMTQDWGKRTARPTVPMEPGSTWGWLTAVRQMTPTSTYTVFRCLCGAEVTRQHSMVRKAIRNGGSPRCKTHCKGAP